MTNEQQSNVIRLEADRILNESGLMEALNRFGKTLVHGSYALDLMTWRDLDMYVETVDWSESRFFDLGKAIAACVQPSKMSYRNERQGETDHLPRGLYWGAYAGLFGQTWKFDVWALDAQQYRQKQEAFALLAAKINDGNRPFILSLKSELHRHPEYRRTFFSVDVYEAVFEGIRTKAQFSNWLGERRGLRYCFD
ncbi:hypothetical protein GZH47_19615 [Paenibacillus rhizovicinus]|uniref:Uncharacterized protein n=1 Tax=Paenibacillus rhizovicinus TaxID=2704463 RepID=A0A6C0P2U0_9BACL|nr:hypothetical protein [Paenibacillus rhizovicinus]QHW32797.1 hypothetical protein GZH47_19615 [Paenibacillus rhizovicinus]